MFPKSIVFKSSIIDARIQRLREIEYTKTPFLITQSEFDSLSKIRMQCVRLRLPEIVATTVPLMEYIVFPNPAPRF